MRKFILVLVELFKPLHKLLKKNVPFRRDEKQQKVFQKAKNVLREFIWIMLWGGNSD